MADEPDVASAESEAAPPKSASRWTTRLPWRWIAAVAALIVVGGVMFGVGRWTAPSGGTDDMVAATEVSVGAAVAGGEATTASTVAPAAGGEESSTATIATDQEDEPVAAVAAAVAPAVVQIETDAGLGSGVVYRSDGYILTAAHVVDGSDQVSVRLADGTRLEGEVVGVNDEADVGVVKVETDSLEPATLALGAEIRLGQLAVAIGSPWGLDQTVTAGVVSSVRRAVPGPDGSVRAMIQTDASINPGNSGGALADAAGRVIGINDSIISTSGTNGGVGFVIPIDTAVSVADRLISGEEIRTAFLGVGGTAPTEGRAGALITEVVEGSAAEAAGLLTGDLIVDFDDAPVTSFIDLAGYIRSSNPGDQVSLTVVRDGEEISIDVVLGEQTD